MGDTHRGIKQFNTPFRLFNDPVHGHIELNEVCQLIVDTKEFQRLRDIKQLGFVDFVFPGATHTRFEHSLGSYHLAGIFVRRLRDYQKEITITDTDILCVEIAALCHDIGCGPFSTLFSKKFIPSEEKFKQRNRLMFDHMVETNKILKDSLNEFGINDFELKYIKDIIDGRFSTEVGDRRRDKQFLLEIVQNQRNGIDVCKFDYMARDSQNLGIQNNFDFHRYMEFARVIEVEGEKQICTRDKEVGNLYNLFFTRYNLHKFAYQHPVVCGIDEMILDVLHACKDNPIFHPGGQCNLTLNDCLNFEASSALPGYTRLTDGILFSLRNSGWPKTELIERLYSRDIYKFLYERPPTSNEENMTDKEKLEELIYEKVPKGIIEKNDIRVVLTYLNFGMKGSNPIDKLMAYHKGDLNTATKIEKKETIRLLEGMNYDELRVRVYATFSKKEKDYKDKIKSIKLACEKCLKKT